MRTLLVALLLTACGTETGIGRGRLPEPADPPVRELDLWGTPPTDWQGCYRGLRGLYYNLTPDHADVERLLTDDVGDTDPPLALPDDLDWWDGDLAFQRYDANQDFGPNWWPVDGGFSGDPQYFAARWVGWVRVTRRGDQRLVIGASSDAWVRLNDDVVVELTDIDDFETGFADINLNTGVYRLDVRYAHRLGETNGFRFRFASDDVLVCYPEYGDDPEAG